MTPLQPAPPTQPIQPDRFAQPPGTQLAQVNIGRTVAPLDSPALAGFVAQLAEVNALAERSPGFVWRLVDDAGADATGLRPDRDDDLLQINCSVWESVRALHDYVYRSDHLRVLASRRDWFQPPAAAHLALWWVPAGHRPDVAEAMARIATLREHGPGPDAFTFRELRGAR
ncbi:MULTISPECIES: DUF3291 domain-containing protein [Kitasatospora]|uniref:DUF3291 domain-containing protein n=1 Tax=Kitasatospora setae (strain ATCC 33774 / DSM 43861 / JCM 3304 / KCC A-0304 / NBRC 14216 / KM-6054) TaxID=452652 RepID=E4N6J1_KITSK|nr:MULTISPECIES: DUF3291 domain-containing protein [Kitasatospora]BAJ26822.1 hypothetical protein KSE_09860 [Kitasatospora setae KM-6054]